MKTHIIKIVFCFLTLYSIPLAQAEHKTLPPELEPSDEPTFLADFVTLLESTQKHIDHQDGAQALLDVVQLELLYKTTNHHNPILKAQIVFLKGWAHHWLNNRKNFLKAKKFYRESLKILETEVENKQSKTIRKRIALVHNNLGCLYADLNNLDKAIVEHKKASKFLDRYDPFYIYNYNNLGTVFRLQKKYTQSYESYLKALGAIELVNAHGGNKSKTSVYKNMGLLCFEWGHDEQGWWFLQEAKKGYLAEEYKDDAPSVKAVDEALRTLEDRSKDFTRS